jgi:two-component system response regulator YesN
VKPTDPNEVIRAVMKCIQRIHMIRNTESQTMVINKSDGVSEDRQQEVLNLLIREKVPSKPVYTDSSLHYAVLAIQIEDKTNIPLKLQESVELLRKKMRLEIIPDIIPIVNMVIVVVSTPHSEMLHEQLIEWAEEIQFWHRQFMDTSVSIGISHVLQGFSQLHQQYIESQRALGMTFYYGTGSILIYAECFNQDPIHTSSKSEQKGESKEELLLCSIKQGNEEKTVIQLEQWFIEFMKNQTKENDVKFQVYKWIFYIFLHMPLEEKDKNTCENTAQEILTSNSILTIKEKVWSIIRLIIYQYKSDMTDHHQTIIQQVERYIHQHYNKPETSLTAVAEHVHLSPNYVSRLIKRKMGKSFTEWLNEYRLEEAKILLQNKQTRNYWVAEKVGIPDARYFSQLFRKYTKLTPTEYKTLHHQEV